MVVKLLVLFIILELIALPLSFALDIPIDVAVTEIFPTPTIPVDFTVSFINFSVTNFGKETVTVLADIVIVGPGHAEAHFAGNHILDPNETSKSYWGFIPCGPGEYYATVNTTIRSAGYYDPNPINNFNTTFFTVVDDCHYEGENGCGLWSPFCTG